MKYILVILGIILEISFILIERKKKLLLALIFKSLAAFLFFYIGYLAFKENPSLYNKEVVIGLFCGFLGDTFLGIRYLLDKGKNIIYLLGCFIFLLGHIFYIVALYPLCTYPLFIIFLGIIFSGFLIKGIVSNLEVKTKLVNVIPFYCVIISIMAFFAIGNFIQNKKGIIFLIGAILFLISDMLMLQNNFAKKRNLTIRVIHLFVYYIGQLLIALSLH